MVRSLNYDDLARAYSQHRGCHEGVLRELTEAIGTTGASRVAEVGAGTGNYAGALRRLLGCSCWAFDPSREMLDIARSRYPDLNVEVGAAEQLPLAAGSVDFVFCVDVIHHVTDRQAFFAEARRVLCASGTLCIVTDSEDIIRSRVPLSSYFPETVEVELQRYPAIAELRGLASSAGFRTWRESRVVTEGVLSSAEAYEAKACSALHLISASAFDAGLRRLKADLARQPLRTVSRYALLWATT
ncbi:MAG TPA: class I SAM-dependent methyltransferase [Polyangiaceae bacterium]